MEKRREANQDKFKLRRAEQQAGTDFYKVGFLRVSVCLLFVCVCVAVFISLSVPLCLGCPVVLSRTDTHHSRMHAHARTNTHACTGEQGSLEVGAVLAQAAATGKHHLRFFRFLSFVLSGTSRIFSDSFSFSDYFVSWSRLYQTP